MVLINSYIISIATFSHKNSWNDRMNFVKKAEKEERSSKQQMNRTHEFKEFGNVKTKNEQEGKIEKYIILRCLLTNMTIVFQ